MERECVPTFVSEALPEMESVMLNTSDFVCGDRVWLLLMDSARDDEPLFVVVGCLDTDVSVFVTSMVSVLVVVRVCSSVPLDVRLDAERNAESVCDGESDVDREFGVTVRSSVLLGPVVDLDRVRVKEVDVDDVTTDD